MLEIVLTPKILGPREIGALGLSLFSLMVNQRLPGKLTVEKQRNGILQKQQADAKVIYSHDDHQMKADLRSSFPLFNSAVQEI